MTEKPLSPGPPIPPIPLIPNVLTWPFEHYEFIEVVKGVEILQLQGISITRPISKLRYVHYIKRRSRFAYIDPVRGPSIHTITGWALASEKHPPWTIRPRHIF